MNSVSYKFLYIFLRKMMGTAESIDMKNCLLLNVSSCPTTETSDDFVVTIYNPLSRVVHPLMRIPVASTDTEYSIKCPMGKWECSVLYWWQSPLQFWRVSNRKPRFFILKFRVGNGLDHIISKTWNKKNIKTNLTNPKIKICLECRIFSELATFVIYVLVLIFRYGDVQPN